MTTPRKNREESSKRGARAPGPVDFYVGQRIRSRRLLLGISQHKLAKCLRLALRQVQKYESGENRLSTERLAQVASALNVSVGWLFDGISAAEPAEPMLRKRRSGLRDHERLVLGQCYDQIGDRVKQRALLEIAQAMANAEKVPSSKPPRKFTRAR